jgi:twitching motility protein PilT
MIAYGMQTFDQSLMGLVKDGKVSYNEAMRQATNPNDFALRMKGIRGTSDSKWDSFEGEKAEERGETEDNEKTKIFQDGIYRDI